MAKDIEVVATVPGGEGQPDKSASITVKYAETLEEAKQMFGEEAVLTNAFANWRVTLQYNIRSAIKRGEDAATIQARLGSAKMGVAQQGAKVDPVQAYLAKFASATPEEQKKMLAELQSRAAKK